MINEKNYFLISIFPVIPISIALMYAAGLNYYHAYLRAFGIPYGIFNIEVNEALFFGSEILAIYSYNLIKYAVCIAIFLCFLLNLFRWIINKLNLSCYVRCDSSSNNSFSSYMEVYLILFCYCMILVMMLMFVFGKVIQFASNYGEEMGNKHKAKFDKTLLIIKNNKIQNTDAFIFKMNSHQADKIGYIIASKADILALYTIHGLLFEQLSNIAEIQKYK